MLSTRSSASATSSWVTARVYSSSDTSLLLAQPLQAGDVLRGLFAAGGGAGQLGAKQRVVEPDQHVALPDPVAFEERQRGELALPPG